MTSIQSTVILCSSTAPSPNHVHVQRCLRLTLSLIIIIPPHGHFALYSLSPLSDAADPGRARGGTPAQVRATAARRGRTSTEPGLRDGRRVRMRPHNGRPARGPQRQRPLMRPARCPPRQPSKQQRREMVTPVESYAAECVMVMGFET